MIEVIPAIIAQDFQEIKKKIVSVDGLVNWVQIDIIDGLFAPTNTWESFQDLLELEGKTKVEVHLMVEQPEHYLADWMRVADRVIVHFESTEHLPEIVTQFENVPVNLGVALLLETPLEKLHPFKGKISFIQLLGIKNIGRQGEKFEARCLDRIHALRSTWPDVTISVDGGITLDNAEKILEAGADNLVIGSAIWESVDVAKTIQQFQKL